MQIITFVMTESRRRGGVDDKCSASEEINDLLKVIGQWRFKLKSLFAIRMQKMYFHSSKRI